MIMTLLCCLCLRYAGLHSKIYIILKKKLRNNYLRIVCVQLSMPLLPLDSAMDFPVCKFLSYSVSKMQLLGLFCQRHPIALDRNFEETVSQCHWAFVTSITGMVGGAVASRLACSSLDRAALVRTLAGDFLIMARYSHSACLQPGV